MTPQFSRRVGKIMNMDAIIALTIRQRQKFARRVAGKKYFKDLSDADKKLIITAERQLKKIKEA